MLQDKLPAITKIAEGILELGIESYHAVLLFEKEYSYSLLITNKTAFVSVHNEHKNIQAAFHQII